MLERRSHTANFTGGASYDTHIKAIRSDEGDFIRLINGRNGRTNNGSFGGVVNVKGNALSAYDLPAGENIVVGAKESKSDSSVIYWIYNSLGDHRIVKYIPGTGEHFTLNSGSKLGLRSDLRVHQASVIDGGILQWTDARNTFISGIDGTPPRYNDIVRSTLYQKRGEFDVVVAAESFHAEGMAYVATIRRGGVVQSTSIIYTVPDGATADSKAELYAGLMTGLNAQFPTLLTADDCGGCKLDVVMKNEGDWWIEIYTLSGDGETFYTLPRNRYHKDADKYSTYLGKLTPICPPTFEMIYDEDISYNYVQGRYFQFAVRYVYYDSQRTCLSSYSKITAETAGCSGVRQPDNTIKIDFTNDILTTEKYLSDIKYVDVMFRESNTGSFYRIKRVERCDLTFPNQYVLFRNDEQYVAVDDSIALRDSDKIPLLAAAHETVNDRSYWGATLEAYDNLDCVEASAEVLYQDTETCSKDTVTVRGKVKIYSPLQTGNRGENIRTNQPIWTIGDSETYYWGTIPDRGGGSFDENEAIAYKQTMPLGGPVAYLAGTNLYGIGVQATISGITQLANGVVSLNPGDLEGNFDTLRENGDTYCEFEIRNVPKGKKYLVRIASHLCMDGDGNGDIFNINNGTAWQGTSTNVYKVGSAEGFELEIDTDVVGDEVDITDTPFIIADLSNPGVQDTKTAAGYVIDALTDFTGDEDAIKLASRIELAKFLPDIDGWFSRTKVRSANSKTDHNGFFFVSTNGNQYDDTEFSIGSEMIRNNGEGAYRGTLNDLFNGSLVTASAVSGGDNSLTEYIVYNRNEDISNCKRTKIEGRVIDQTGRPVGGLAVVFSKTGRTVYTDANGEYSMSVYADGVQNNRVGKLYFYSKFGCCPVIETNSLLVNISQFVCLGLYSSEEVYTMADLVVETLVPITAVWKHRNRVMLGIKYYDEFGRSSKVQISNELSQYIPFWNENGGNVGLPYIQWAISHRPPSWAVRYQIVRVLNPLYSKYVQFAVSEVKYAKNLDTSGEEAEFSETTYEAGDATRVYISLQPLIDYADVNYGSILSWEFAKEDRVSFMKDENGDWLPFYDDEVINATDPAVTTSTYLAMKFTNSMPKLSPGATIELYTQRKKTSTDLYYEIGECYSILNPGTDNAVHGAGYNGVAQTGSTAATGIIERGDCFIQTRSMPIIDPDDVVDRFNIIDEFESEYADETNVDSKVQDIGRFDIVDREYRQIYYESRVRHSGRYIPDSAINSLNVFDAASYLTNVANEEMSRNFGGVTFLGFVGSVLMSIHKFKCVPIYIAAGELTEQTGETFISASDKFAQIAQPIAEERGTQNPESVVINNNNIYAYDFDKRAYWKYGYSGIFTVSEYNANEYWRAATDVLRQQAVPVVLSIYDVNYDELLVHAKNNGHTISFVDHMFAETAKNRWVTEYQYEPECMCKAGRTVVTFKDGQLWVHDANDIRGSFYGVKSAFGVDVPVNSYPDSKKIFWGLRVKATDRFITTDRGIIVYDSDRTMVSQLKEAHFSRMEGDWWADFLRNMDDPEYQAEGQIAALLRSSSPLKGDTMLLSIRNNSEGNVFLHSIDVSFSVSPKTV